MSTCAMLRMLFSSSISSTHPPDVPMTTSGTGEGAADSTGLRPAHQVERGGMHGVASTGVQRYLSRKHPMERGGRSQHHVYDAIFRGDTEEPVAPMRQDQCQSHGR